MEYGYDMIAGCRAEHTGREAAIKIHALTALFLLLTACAPAASPQPTSTPQVTATAGLSPEPSLVLSPLPAASPTPQPNCTESALFVTDVTIADNSNLKAGQSFIKTWQLRNTGTCTWNAGYTLVFTGGDQMSGPAAVPLGETAPDATLELSVDLVAPTTDGAFTGLYEIRNPAGQAIPIGLTNILWVKIRVGNVAVVTQATATQAGSSNPVVGVTVQPGGPCSPQRNGNYAAQVLSLINAARANAGLSALHENAKLQASAQTHSDDMACSNQLSHTGSNGSSIYDRIVAAGYSPSFWEEIIFASGTPQQAFDWWMNDPPHRDAILDSRVEHMGAGYTFVAGSAYGGYFTVDFARP